MKRRDFARMTGLGAVAMHAIPAMVAGNSRTGTAGPVPGSTGRSAAPAANIFHGSGAAGKLNVPIGVGNHSLRAWRPNGMELIDYAIRHKLDSVQFNTLAPFEQLDDQYLGKLRKHAKEHDITIYVGVGSISEKSGRFNSNFGDADTLVKEGIRVAKALGSPVLGVRIGALEDRYSEGGIRPKMEEVIRRMRSFRGPMADAGIKFAFENHAGDMRSEELLQLIDATGTDICGAFFDPGNATYAMEDPKVAMEAVGKHILCCSARDVVIWQTADGAMFQWTAVGEGMMDYRWYAQFMAEQCPGVPIHLEIISNSPRSIPYLEKAYWEGWPELKAAGIIDFLKIARQGKPISVAIPPSGMDKKTFEMKNQEEELLRSVHYLRNVCGLGLE